MGYHLSAKGGSRGNFHFKFGEKIITAFVYMLQEMEVSIKAAEA